MEKLIKQFARYTSDMNPLYNENMLDSFNNSLDDYTGYFDDITEKWFDTFNEELGATPKEYLYGLKKPENEEETYEIIRLLSLNLITMAPKVFVDYLGEIEYTKPVVKRILRDDVITESYDVLYNVKEKYEAFEIYRQAVVLSQAYDDLADDLLEGFKKCHPANDNILEYIVESLAKLNAYDKIIEFLNGVDVIESKHLSILDVLKNNKSDATYNCMRKSFKKIKDDFNKNIVAYMFGEFGDSRAVPLLRKHAMELRGKMMNGIDMDEETRKDLNWSFYMVCSTIEQLGGNIEDLKIF